MNESDDRIAVLVVEDDPIAVRLLEMTLCDRFKLSFVGTMRQAELTCAETSPDIVLQDLCLPDSFGLETVERAKQMAPHCPIVILSSYVTNEFRDLVVDDQIVDALNKADVGPDAIIRVLRTTVQRERARVQNRVSRCVFDTIERISRRLALMGEPVPETNPDRGGT